MPAVDRFMNDEAWAPSRNAFTITPHDTNQLSDVTKGIYVGGAGVVTLRTANGLADVAFTCPAGVTLDVAALYVRATGTTATLLVGLA